MFKRWLFLVEWPCTSERIVNLLFTIAVHDYSYTLEGYYSIIVQQNLLHRHSPTIVVHVNWCDMLDLPCFCHDSASDLIYRCFQ